MKSQAPLLLSIAFLIISISAQSIPPTVISNSTYPVKTFVSWPNIVSLGTSGRFAIVYAGGKGEVFVQSFPEQNVTTLGCPTGLVFDSAHSLPNGGFSILCLNLENNCNTESQVYDENINPVGTFNFTSSLDCVGGIAVIPLDDGIMMIGATASENSRSMYGEFHYYNGTQGNKFDVPCHHCTTFGPGAPFGSVLSNGSILLFWSVNTYGSPLEYEILSPNGTVLTNSSVTPAGFVNTLIELTNDQFVIQSWTANNVVTLIFFDASENSFYNYTSKFGTQSASLYIPGPAVALSNGNFVVFANFASTHWNYVGQIFNATGPVSDQFSIPNFNFMENNLEDNYDELLAFSDGTFVLTWTGSSVQLPALHVYAQRYTNDGNTTQFIQNSTVVDI